jgi:hypothetical protein
VTYISLRLFPCVSFVASEFDLPLAALNFPRLLQQADDVDRLRQARRISGPVYDSPEQCIRSLFASVLPACLSEAKSRLSESEPLASPRSSSDSSSTTSGRHSTSFERGHNHTSSVSTVPDSRELIQQHIRNASHFAKHREQQQESKEGKGLEPIMEQETPPPGGCCGKSTCSIM